MALGVEPAEVWNYPRRFRAKPFVELVNFPEAGGGAIGPITSAKLYEDFVAFAPRARRYYAACIPNVFTPPRVDARAAENTTHRKRIGLSAVAALTRSLFGTELDWDEGENLDWIWDSYRQFRRALRLAKDAGLLAFYRPASREP
jgi:hypothetical protein